VALVVGASLAFAGAAYGADGNSAPDPAKATATVKAERLNVRAVSRQTAGATRAYTTASCREATWRVSGHNLLGWRLWSYVRWVRWCWSGSTLTSVSTRAWGEVHMVGWAFRGTISSWSAGGAGRGSYRVWSQGHFCLVEYFSCIQNVYPWIDVTVLPGGGWRWSWGG
jgi:hypothetical protein